MNFTINMLHPPRRARLKGGLVGLALALTLTHMPVSADTQTPSENGNPPTFYPALPDLPRIQHLTTLTGEREMRGPISSFARFILGDDDSAQQLVQPYGSAMFDGRLYVVDTGLPGVAIFDFSQNRFSYLAGSANGQMSRPINIRIDADGTKYIADAGRDQILIYNRDDRFVAAYGKQGEFKPTDVAIADDKLYVCDIAHHQIHVLEKRTGETLYTFGKPGSGPGELFHPTNIAIGPEGDLYISETSNFRIQRFTPEGEPVRTYGAVGSAPGAFARPKGIAIDRAGRLLVSDAAFENVQIFDNSAKLLMFFGQSEDADERMNLPTGVTIDYDNVKFFNKYVDPGFQVEYLILVASQFGPNKVDIYGFGRMKGMKYPEDADLVALASH